MKRNFSLHYQCIFKQKGNKKKDLLPNCLRKKKQKRVYTCLASFTLAKVLTLKGGITCIKSHKCWFPHVSCQVFRKVFWVGCRKCHHLLVWWQRWKYPAARDRHMFLLTNPLTGLSILHEALNWPILMSSPVAHLAKAYPSFLSMKQIEILLPLPNLDGMLIYHKVTPVPPPSPLHFIKLPWQSTSTHLYFWVERGMMTVLCCLKTLQIPNPDLLIQSPVHWPLGHSISHRLTPLSPTSD